MSKKEPTWLDGILGSAIRDTQGEMLSVEGADITELEAGKGRWNDNHGKGAYNSLGRITYAKKIFKAEDCEDERQRYYWEKIKAPYIYGKGYLYDDEGHPNACAAAAILRNLHKNDSPLKLKLSVEGGILARGIKDPSLLARTKINGCAITFTPANQATLVEPLNLGKSYHSIDDDMKLIKSVVHLAKTNVPSFRHITRRVSAQKLMDNLNKIQDMAQVMGIEVRLPYGSVDEIVDFSVQYKLKKNIEKINSLIKLAKVEEEERKLKDFLDLFEKYVQLRKAVPKPDTHAYNLGLGDKKGGKFEGYTGKDAKKAQLHALKTAMNNPIAEGNHVRMMEHLETGKKEPHILLHHGINHKTGDATGTASKRPKDAGNHNVFSVKDGIVDHPSFGVHTLYHSVADEYTNNNHGDQFHSAGEIGAHYRTFKEGDDWIAEDTHDSGVHSFWVPVSGLHSMRQYENSRFKNEQFPLPEGYFNKENHENKVEAREEISDDPHADEQKHIVIRPGKYRQASHDDLKELHEKSKKDKWSQSPFENSRRYFTKDGVIENGKKVELNKALTAGYGGASAPTARTGGSIMQTETMDSGRPGFRYITCYECGDEQIHHKHQTKCRNCQKSFPFSQLVELVSKK